MVQVTQKLSPLPEIKSTISVSKKRAKRELCLQQKTSENRNALIILCSIQPDRHSNLTIYFSGYFAMVTKHNVFNFVSKYIKIHFSIQNGFKASRSSSGYRFSDESTFGHSGDCL